MYSYMRAESTPLVGKAGVEHMEMVWFCDIDIT